ncbi:hypothetical protein [Phosphitispora sp. TUW77]|uniref:hypothetical protein n=1 Tax=Phosphitispora sp. TUW77 TaxID=3152361 RepID=UPI003AB49F17
MSYLFIFLGAIFVGLAVWRGRVSDVIRQQEIQEYRQLKKDLRLARSDVEMLLDQLEAVSEKVVADVSAGIEEAEIIKDLKILEVMEKEKEKEKPQNNSGPVSVTAKKTNNTIMFPRSFASPEDEGASTASLVSKMELSAKHQMVYAMERLGYPEDEIARQMNIGKGEVSLILQIKRKGEELNA